MRAGILLLCVVPLFSWAEEDSSTTRKSYWESGQPRVTETGRPKVYTTALHNKYSDIKGNYQENGVYYYSDAVNSFGFQEVLNVKQEMIFCGAGDMTFSDSIRNAMSASNQSSISNTTAVHYDAAQMGISAETMESEIKVALDNNSNPNAKGRFCYNRDDPEVDYRAAGAEDAVYCQTGGAMSYTDTVSGYSCELRLDIDLKRGETRYLRQLQGVNPTIAQGFVGCYANATSGQPELVLLDNPDDCSPSNRNSCIRTCDWAENVVCDPRDLSSGSGAVRWGPNNACGAYGSVLFKGDVVEMDSSPQISYSSSDGILYEGSAIVACADVNGTANWVITTSECNPVN